MGAEVGVVTIREACKLARVTRRTIYNWMEAGKVRYVRTASGAVRIFSDSLFGRGNAVAVVATDRATGQREVRELREPAAVPGTGL